MLLVCSGNELHDTTGFLDFAFSVFAEIAGSNDDRHLGQTTLAEDFAVAERKEVEDWGGVGFGALGEVLLALLERDEGPELGKSSATIFLFGLSVRSDIPCRG